MTEVRVFVIGGRDAGRTFVLDSDSETVIGREPACDIRLADKSISRRHARLAYEGGAWELSDLGSRNGVLRGSERMKLIVLEDGDVISLGEVPIRFRLPQSSRDPAPSLRGPVEVEPEEVRLEEDELEEEIELDDEPLAETVKTSRPAIPERTPRAQPTPLAEPSAEPTAVQRTTGRSPGEERYARVLGQGQSDGWMRRDLSQLPLVMRIGLALALLALGALIFLLAFRGMQMLRG